MKQMILVVDADSTCRDVLRTSLQRGGFDVTVLYEPCKVVKRLEDGRPALIAMSGGEALGSAIEVLEALRYCGDGVPVTMLSERGDVVERIVAPGHGADDFVYQPFNTTVVLIRTWHVLARSVAVHDGDIEFKPQFCFHGFEPDYASRTRTLDVKVMPLSKGNYTMLHLFTDVPDQRRSRAKAARRMWADPAHRSVVRRVDVNVRRSRHLIGTRAATPKMIRTIHARGLRFLSGRWRRARTLCPQDRPVHIACCASDVSIPPSCSIPHQF